MKGVGEGDQCRFWKNEWLNGKSLANLFPRLYLISVQKKDLVGEVGFWRERWCGDLKWRRDTFVWEMALIDDSQSLLGVVQVKRNSLDSWRWSNISGTYSTSSAYKILIKEAEVEMDNDFYTLMWQLKIPNKVKFLIWRAVNNRLATKDNFEETKHA